jgi:hypothetical protein
MANEITLNQTLSVRNGSANYSMSASVNATQTLQGGVVRKQTVPTADTVIVLTGVTTPRVIAIKNLDATNYIDIGPTSGGVIVNLIRLKAGECCQFPITPSAVIRGQANTGSVIIEYLILET